MPKINSKRCELIKLCHINRSGPVFLRRYVDKQIFVALSYTREHDLAIGSMSIHPSVCHMSVHPSVCHMVVLTRN